MMEETRGDDGDAGMSEMAGSDGSGGDVGVLVLVKILIFC